MRQSVDIGQCQDAMTNTNEAVYQYVITESEVQYNL